MKKRNKILWSVLGTLIIMAIFGGIITFLLWLTYTYPVVSLILLAIAVFGVVFREFWHQL